jgi:hypothetical protein
MNITEKMMRNWGYEQVFAGIQRYLQVAFGSSEIPYCCDTYQFKDYAKMVAPRFDAEKKAKRRAQVFLLDCEKALALGAGFAQKQKYGNMLVMV